MMRSWRVLVSVCLSASLFGAGSGWADPGAEVVVDVDSARREMRVLREDRVLAVFDHVAVGRWGVTEEKRLGDGKTPLGHFRIAWMQSTGEFGPFMGFGYPSLARAEKGSGFAGGPEKTRTTYFYESGVWNPFGNTWGAPFAPTELCEIPLPTPEPFPSESFWPWDSLPPGETPTPDPGGGGGAGGGQPSLQP